MKVSKELADKIFKEAGLSKEVTIDVDPDKLSIALEKHGSKEKLEEYLKTTPLTEDELLTMFK